MIDAAAEAAVQTAGEFQLITTLVLGLGLALFCGLVATKIRLPALVGYLAAGIVIGSALPFVAEHFPTLLGLKVDAELFDQLAEIGVMLLMFGVGLHFSFKDLMAVRKIAVPGAIVQTAVTICAASALAHSLHWPWGQSVVYGMALSVASTVVLIRNMESTGDIATIKGQIAVGWLVVEDLLTVVLLVLLPPLSGWLAGGSGESLGAGALALALLKTFGKIAVFVGLMLVIGTRTFPWLLWRVARNGSHELFMISVIAVAVGIAYAAYALFDVSFALGAFFAGMIVKESPLATRAGQESQPFRDLFSILFFVSVGMLFDPRVLLKEPLWLLLTVGVVMVGKPVVASAIMLVFRYPLNAALTVGAGLAQIGEFSFILVALGKSLGVIEPDVQSLVVACAILSIGLNSLVFRFVTPLQRRILSNPMLARIVDRPADPLAQLPASVPHRALTGHVVVVGYAGVGKRIVEYLQHEGIPFVVADSNRTVVEQLREQGVHAVTGNVSEAGTLIQAHIAQAGALAVTTTDAIDLHRIVEVARILRPSVRILIRSTSAEEADRIVAEGMGTVFLEEQEISVAMCRALDAELRGKGSAG